MNELVNDLLKFPSVLKYKNKNVTFFGSARFDEENFYCKGSSTGFSVCR